MHDEIASDKRDPTVNAGGPIYGATEESTQDLPVLDPVKNIASTIHIPVRDANTPNSADNEKIASEIVRPGRKMVRMSDPQVSTASGPIQLVRCRGRKNRVNSGVTIVVDSAIDAITIPVAIDPPPSLAA